MEPYRVRSLVLIAAVLALAAPAGLAEEAILVTVDATRTQQKLLHTYLVMPVKSGPLTLYYPKWIPGEHGPYGPIANLTGLKFEADGQTIPWQRDLLDVFTFHLEIPHGISHLGVNFDYIEPDGRLKNCWSSNGVRSYFIRQTSPPRSLPMRPDF